MQEKVQYIQENREKKACSLYNFLYYLSLDIECAFNYSPSIGILLHCQGEAVAVGRPHANTMYSPSIISQQTVVTQLHIGMKSDPGTWPDQQSVSIKDHPPFRLYRLASSIEQPATCLLSCSFPLYVRPYPTHFLFSSPLWLISLHISATRQ